MLPISLVPSDADLRSIHRYSSRHRDRVKTSSQCGCFYCESMFASTQISDWIDPPDGHEFVDDDFDVGVTALCPRCGIDSVLPDNISGVVVDPDLLRAMRRHWFDRSA